jgi:hypothetical protein
MLDDTFTAMSASGWCAIKSVNFFKVQNVKHQHICAVCHRLVLCTAYDGQLIAFGTQRKLETKVSFQIRRSSSSYEHSGNSIRSLPTQSRDLQVSPHHDAIAAVRAIPAPLLDGVVQVPAGIGLAPVQGFLDNTLNALEPLLSRIDTFVRIGRAFSEVWARLRYLGAD